MPDPSTIYVLWISNSAPRDSPTGALCWSRPFAVPTEARAFARARIDRGEATFAVVLSFRDDHAGKPLGIYPESARKVVEHWLEIRAAAAQGPPAT